MTIATKNNLEANYNPYLDILTLGLADEDSSLGEYDDKEPLDWFIKETPDGEIDHYVSADIQDWNGYAKSRENQIFERIQKVAGWDALTLKRLANQVVDKAKGIPTIFETGVDPIDSEDKKSHAA